MQPRTFTLEQLKQAGKSGYISTRQKQSRAAVRADSIDHALPETSADRDDAVGTESTADGGYQVYVHIADVAEYIPKNTPLDLGAQERAFTRYRPEARDPMFPMELSEGRLSLEHRCERLALTIIITLDSGFMPMALQFARTRLTAEAHDYERARERIHTRGDKFQFLAHVARGILNPEEITAAYDEKTGLRVDAEGLVSFMDPAHLPVAKMVEAYMVLANRVVAEFAHKSGLPFLYRNHGASVRGGDPALLIHNIRDILSESNALTEGERVREMKRMLARLHMRRATYAPEKKGHLALNLSEGYGHFTSPIRRYPDLVNQRIIHYAIDQVETVEKAISALARLHSITCDKQKLRAIAWKPAPEMLYAIMDTHQTGKRRRAGKEHTLQRILRDMVQEALPEHVIPSRALREFASDSAAELLARAVPYTKRELRPIAAHVNKAAAAERKAVQQISIDKAANWIKKIFPDTDPRKLSAFTPGYFSALLLRTAQAGHMNEVFYHEVIRRLEDRRLDVPYDIYSILMEAKEYDSELWRNLKKRALRTIEADGMAQISHVFSTARNNHTIPAETDIVEGICHSKDTGEPLHVARVVTEIEGRAYSAPHYSLAYTDKGARKRAIYDFICCIAFNDLVPMEEAVLPSRFYAELESHQSTVVLEKIAAETGLKLESAAHSGKGQAQFTYTVEGNSLPEPLTATRHAPTVEEAQHKAARAILRRIEFKRAIARHDPVAVEFGRMPEIVLEELVASRNLPKPEIEIRDFKDLAGQRRFEALLMMDVPGQKPFILSRESAIKRLAIRQCCRDALVVLEKMGVK